MPLQVMLVSDLLHSPTLPQAACFTWLVCWCAIVLLHVPTLVC